MRKIMVTNASRHEDDDRDAETFEGWAEPMIGELAHLVDRLLSEVTFLRGRVLRLEQSAGRGLIHPSDLLEGSN
jgi:hypothetical protein